MESKKPSDLFGSNIPRRSFLKGALAASALSALGAPYVFAKDKSSKSSDKTEGTTDKVSANERVNIACVGIGNRGGQDIDGMDHTGHANIVALCDTELGGSRTKKMLSKHSKAETFKDFRVMLDKMGSKIDAVCIGVPDFSHFPIAMACMMAGKHIYVEKPMGQSFHEIELMMQAEQKFKLACQMGNQGHSGANYFQFKAFVDAGLIKNVKKITAFMNAKRRWHGWEVNGLPPKEEIPKELDWDTWLSQRPFHEFNTKYINGDWRCWYDFGNGALGDWGAHILDTAHEFLDLGLPEEVGAVKLDGHNQWIFPQASTLSFKFPARGNMPPCEVTWYDGQKNQPPLPNDFGDPVEDPDVPPPAGGKLKKSEAPGKVIYAEGLTFKGGSHSSTLVVLPPAKAAEMKDKLPSYGKGSDHYKNFLLACKGQEKCRSNFAVAGPLSQVLCMGVIAQHMNARLPFDRVAKQFKDNAKANELLMGPPPRKGWEQYYKI